MIDILLWFKALLLSPLFWGFWFVAMAIPQFFVAQRLHHHQPWYAFVPVLKGLQWFQMGGVQTFHLLGVIPLGALFLVPVVGPDNLQIVLQTIKVVIGLQISLYLLFFWFRAARVITVRSGEKASHGCWLLIPLVNVIVLARLALKSTFWVEDEKEKRLINKIINGINGDHKLTTLKKYAASQGFNKRDFEPVADKALTVKDNQLEVVTDEAIWRHFINYSVGVLLALGALWVALALLNNFSIIFSEQKAPERSVGVTKIVPETSQLKPLVTLKPVPSVKVRPQWPDAFVFIMEVNKRKVEADSIVYSGRLRKGDSINREAQRFYLLDKNFDLLDSVRVESVSGLFAQFSVRTSKFQSPDEVAYIAETKAMRAKNSLGSVAASPPVNESILLITNHDGPSTSKNRELIVTIKRDELAKTDKLYAYDRRLNIINTAKIIYLLNPQKSSVDQLAPTDNVELVLEFEKEYTGKAVFLSPLPTLNSLMEYLKLMVSQ